MDYERTLRRLLVAHKERAALALARPLGLLLAAAVAAAVADPRGPVVLVPVPSQRRSTRLRGHDPVRRMARAAVWALGAQSRLDDVLRHRRRVDDQSHLSVDERRANLAEALRARREVAPSAAETVVVVDDVCSSGATLSAAAQALLSGGVPASRLRAAVVASPPLRRG